MHDAHGSPRLSWRWCLLLSSGDRTSRDLQGTPSDRGHRHARDGRRVFVRDLARWATGRVHRQPQCATGALPRSLDEAAATPLAGTEDGRHPFWSPNGRSIGFATASQLKRMDPDGRRFQDWAGSRLARAERGVRRRYSFFALSVIPDCTEWPQQAAKRSRSRGSAQGRPRTGSHRLPRTQEFLFYAFGQADMQGIISIARLGGHHSAHRRRRVRDVMPPGWLLFINQGTLTASRFDLTRRELSGDPVTGRDFGRRRHSSAESSVLSLGRWSHYVWNARDQHVATDLVQPVRSTARHVGQPDGEGLWNLDLSHDGSRVAAQRTLQNDPTSGSSVPPRRRRSHPARASAVSDLVD